MCGILKPRETGFYRRPRMKDGYSNQCRKCEIAKQAEYQARPDIREKRNAQARAKGRTSEQIRRQRLWTWHRLKPEQYDALLAAQGGVCGVCGSDDPGKRGEFFHVDHDHGCCASNRSCGQCVRGLLCGRCNPMLGFAKDSVETLEAAIAYLRRGYPPIAPSALSAAL